MAPNELKGLSPREETVKSEITNWTSAQDGKPFVTWTMPPEIAERLSLILSADHEGWDEDAQALLQAAERAQVPR